MFQIGKKVVCIKPFTNATENFHLRIPKKHEICTVSSINPDPVFDLCLELEEYPPIPGTDGDQFDARHFRPLEDFPAFNLEAQEQQERIEILTPQTV